MAASDLIARCALTREDSRGAHYREDFPETDNVRWLKSIQATHDGEKVKLWASDVKLTRMKPF